MKKIRLTETELTNIVKRVINEQSSITPYCDTKGTKLMNLAFKKRGLTDVKLDNQSQQAYITNSNGDTCRLPFDELKNIFM